AAISFASRSWTCFSAWASLRCSSLRMASWMWTNFACVMRLPHQGQCSMGVNILLPLCPLKSLFVLLRPSATLVNPIEPAEMTNRVPHPGERDLELVFALAGPVGADLQEVSRMLGDALKNSDYDEVEEIDVSTLIRQIAAKR